MKKILFLIVLFTYCFSWQINLFSQEIEIYPKKKPILKPEIKKKKVSINIIKPLKKPVEKKEIKKEAKENNQITKKKRNKIRNNYSKK